MFVRRKTCNGDRKHLVATIELKGKANTHLKAAEAQEQKWSYFL